jgi:glycosyltransferase involved in cell wall biosynthesis
MKRKVCFVSLGSLPLLTSNQNLLYAGGAELKQIQLAKELVKQQYIVSFVVHDEKDIQKTKDFEDIVLVKSFPSSQDIGFLKKVIMLWKSLKQADADIYVQATYPPGIVALYCFLHRKKYIKWLSSDKSVSLQDVTQRTTLMTKLSLYFDIKLASVIIGQNQYQKETIEKKFRKKCVILKNPVTLSEGPPVCTQKKEHAVLWVGTIRSLKQPELFLEIAKLLPHVKCIMIGGVTNSEAELYTTIERKSKSLSNLSFLGFVPYNKMKEYYLQSSVFVNTSVVEGFPNTFLEAWTHYVPVVSLMIDPDEIICMNKLGFHSRTFKQMIVDIECLLQNDGLRNEMALNGRKYISEYHDVKKVTNQFIKLIASLEK